MLPLLILKENVKLESREEEKIHFFLPHMLMKPSDSTLGSKVRHVCLRFFIIVSSITLNYISHGYLDNNIGADLNSFSAVVL